MKDFLGFLLFIICIIIFSTYFYGKTDYRSGIIEFGKDIKQIIIQINEN